MSRQARRRPPLLVALAFVLGPAGAGLVLSGCGEEEERPRALAPVRLVVQAPSDPSTVDDDRVEVRGTVWPPGSRVLVAGEDAGVEGEAFSAVVQLDPGANVVDVIAGAPRRPAAMAAVRVVRRVPVQIPDVEGLAPGEAAAELEALGLQPEVVPRSGLLDELLPGTEGVCETLPDAGDMVRAGSTVTVVTSKAC